MVIVYADMTEIVPLLCKLLIIISMVSCAIFLVAGSFSEVDSNAFSMNKDPDMYRVGIQI